MRNIKLQFTEGEGGGCGGEGAIKKDSFGFSANVKGGSKKSTYLFTSCEIYSRDLFFVILISVKIILMDSKS